jgi:hypothetical protein
MVSVEHHFHKWTKVIKMLPGDGKARGHTMEETNTDKRDELSKVGRKDGWEKDDDLSSHCRKKMRKK